MNKLDLVELRHYSEAVLDLGILGLMRILDISIASNERDKSTQYLKRTNADRRLNLS